MKKFTKLLAGITAIVLTLGAAGCTPKSTVYPDFRNDGNGSSNSSAETTEKYVINVVSEGGIKLDGVKVTATSATGEVIRRGISENGKIEMAIGLGNYNLVIDEDSLPAGYYLKGDENYQTSATSREEVTIKIPSKLIAIDSNQYSTYSVGGIMKDFVFTDCLGTEYQLSKLFEAGKKAVILNFWYTGCDPCRSEFPAMQRAYASRPDDVEILALSDPRRGDTNAGISNYKSTKLNIPVTFPMGLDTIGLSTAFNVAAYPTTVVIDRYGMIAAKSSGSEPDVNVWTSLFNKYTANNYTQEIHSSNDPDQPSGGVIVEKPDVAAPTPVQIAEALNDGDIKATYRFEDDEYNWPWIISEDGGIMTSNKGKGYSYSIIYADVEMKKDDVLSFEYKVDSEADHDYLHVFIDGDIVNGAGWSATSEWTETAIYVADRDKTVELALAYQKDAADPEDYIGEDVARVRNLHISGKNAIKTPVDIMRACAGGEFDQDKAEYENYVSVVKNTNDGFYHVGTADGPILYITLTQLTPWSNARTGSMFNVNGESFYNTLYNRTYWGYATGDADHNNFKVQVGTADITQTLMTYFEFQKHMEEPFYFLPVNEDLKIWAEAFVKDFEAKNGYVAGEDEWLEFCYYYDHYGSENYAHTEGDICKYNYDPTEGLTIENCYNAYEQGYFPADIANSDDAKTYNAETQRNKALINIALAKQNGSYYKFTAHKTGVYQIRSYTTSTQPELDENGEPKTDKYGNIIYKSCASNGAVPGLSVFNASGRQIGSTGEIRDRDAYLPENGVIYEGFNHYMTMTEGQTVYLLLETIVNDTAYYDFDITYKGETYETMYIASTMPGVWSYHENDPSNQYYLAISTAYDSDSGIFYASDRSGNPSWDQPIYIDMIGESCIVSDYGQSNYKPLTWFVENNVFARRIKDGTGNAKQAKMREYLEAALSKDKDDPEYGLIPANQEIVSILNAFIDANVDGGAGMGNGWLAFACYMEHFGR